MSTNNRMNKLKSPPTSRPEKNLLENRYMAENGYFCVELQTNGIEQEKRH